ncbi:MAG TPA: hypothetical protein VLA17_15495, partial [Candidatus Limnocylindria bacterium]|nr:hypothetical protein [Candidatus Limnocylindria bacterium]
MKPGRGVLRRKFFYSWLIGVVAVCFLPRIGAIAAEQESPVPSKAAESPVLLAPPAEIPLTDIATRTTEVSNLISSLTAAAVPGAQIESIAKSLPDLSAKLDAELAATTTTLEGEASLESLQTLQQQWHRHQVDATAWLHILTQQAVKLQYGLNQLAELEKIWTNTLSSAQTSNAPQPVLEQIAATRAAIAKAMGKVHIERSSVLDLQSRVAQEVTRCGTALAQIGQYQQKAVAGILVPDAPPIWDAEYWARSLQAFPEHVRKVGIANAAEIIQYIREPREGSGFHAAFFAVLALLFSAARRKIQTWDDSGGAASSALSVFERPYSAALTITLLVVTSPFFPMPRAVHHSLTLLSLLPMLRIARPVVSAPLAWALYGLCLLFAVDTLRQSFQGMQVIGRVITLAETLGALALLYGMRRHYGQFLAEKAESSRLILLRLGKIVLIIVLLIALFAGVVGYATLVRLLTPGILVGGVLALAVFSSLRVIGGAVALGLRVWPLRLLHVVEGNRDL